MVKTKTINELQVKLLAFIAKINSAARGNNESIQWLSEESNYLFLKTDNYSNITPLVNFCENTIEGYYQILLRPILNNEEYNDCDNGESEKMIVSKLLKELISRDVWLSTENNEEMSQENKIIYDLILIGLLIVVNKRDVFAELKNIINFVSGMEIDKEENLIEIYEYLSTHYLSNGNNIVTNLYVTDSRLKKILPLLKFDLKPILNNDSEEIKYIIDEIENSHHIYDDLIKTKKYMFYEVKNNEKDEYFNPNKLETKLLAHGTKAKNVLSILNNGISCTPPKIATGSSLGVGAYFAKLNEVGKSLQYSDNILFIAEVATGNEKKVQTPMNYRSIILETKEFDSVHFLGGTYFIHDEFCIYRNNQIKIKYIIEIK